MQLPNCWGSVAVICIQYVLCVTSGKLYTLYKNSHTHEGCRSQGQQWPKTEEELSVIKSVVKKWRNDKHFESGEPGAIWIGLYDLAPDSRNATSFKWTDCTCPGEFINLAKNKDNNDGLQKCVRYTQDHKLRNKEYTNEYVIVCEKERNEYTCIPSSSAIDDEGVYCIKLEHGSPSVPKNKSTVGMCCDTVTNGSTSVLSCSTGTTTATATASTAAESTTESDVTTPKSDVTTPESDVTTIKSESAQTPDATTSSNGKITQVMQLPENLCPNCTTTNNTCVWLSSAGPSVEEMKELIKILTLEKKTLSSYRREKTSASDDRPTAQAIGKVGIVFIVLAFAGVVLLDCGRVVDCLRKRNRKRVIFSKA